jgi:purine-binding chemotaxis protein CheW
MSENSTPLDAGALRRDFDASFARVATMQATAGIDLIGIALGEADYAVRVAQIGGLRTGLALTPCPTPLPELVGIAGIGGVLVPVYDLAALLGLGPGAGRWTILVEGGMLALAFSGFSGHFRVEPDAIAARHGAHAAAPVTEFASHAGRSWPVIDIPSVVAAIRTRLPRTTNQE